MQIVINFVVLLCKFLPLCTIYSLLVADVLFQLSTRFRSNVEEKMRKLGYIGVGVSAVGQRLVDTITKTYVMLCAVFVCMLFVHCGSLDL